MQAPRSSHPYADVHMISSEHKISNFTPHQKEGSITVYHFIITILFASNRFNPLFLLLKLKSCERNFDKILEIIKFH